MSSLSSLCRICERESAPFATARVLEKYDVSYFCCPNCGFVQTEEPYWLDEAYSSAITSIDIGPVNRALNMADKTKALAVTFFNPWLPCLDYGAGYGLLVRRLRDLGLDYRYYDSHCENLFARGFEADPFAGAEFELVTAFEVVEHLPDPVKEIGRLLECTPNLFFSTDLLPAHQPRPGEWWYYAPEFGQHISFFSRRSLDVLAERLKMHVLSVGNLHLLTRKRISPALYSFVLHDNVSSTVARLLGGYRGLGSRLHNDFAQNAGYSMHK